MLTDTETNELIETLRIAREDISIIVGMYNKLGTYKDNVLECKEKIDSALYKLTGNEFYLPEKQGGKA